MSKPIKMTEQYMAECRADFEKALQTTKFADGKLNFTKMFPIGTKKATVFFTGEAWAKMVMLLKNFDKEVAWHGVAYRGADESKDEYIISDIMVYPQEVSGASVEMDTEKYAMWLMENMDDERFDNIHMQGHSHVNMATSPSGVDLNHQEEILNMLGDEDFYIFMIWNKSFVCTNKIYDMKKNTLFEDKDISISIIGCVEDLDVFMSGAKEMVKTKTYTSPAYGNPNFGRGYNPNALGGAYNPVTTPATTPTAPAKGGKSGKKDKPRTQIGAGWAGKNAAPQQSIWEEDEFEDDPYGALGQRGY